MVTTKPISGTCAASAVQYRISRSIVWNGRPSGSVISAGWSEKNTASKSPLWAISVSRR